MPVLVTISKYILRAIWHFTEFVLAFLFLYGSLAIVLSIISVVGEQAESGVKIYVKTNGVHTDICVPVEHEDINWKSFIPTEDFPEVKSHSYLSFGWGDKGFFLDTPTWDDLTFSTAFTAAFLPSPTAMHVQYLESEPVVSATVKQKFVTPENYLDLTNFIKKSFRKNVSGEVDLIANKGYWHNDNFYEANGSYHLFNTCNKWTNDALKIAGIKTAVLALFSDGIMRHLE